MSIAITYTIPAQNVANALAGIATIQNLIANGNANLLSNVQMTAMANVETALLAIPDGVVNYTFNSTQLADVEVFAGAVINLANTGPTLSYTENEAAAGSITPVINDGTPANAYPTNANTGTFIDSYFIVEAPGTGGFFISNSNDGTSWNVLATGTAEANPDNTLAVDTMSGELVVFGQQTIQFFADTAIPPQVFTPVQGATQNYGLAAIYSIAPFQGTLAFLGQNRQGTVQVMVLNGYVPTAISTPDIANLINSFKYVNDALGASFTVDGHEFFVITFPIAGYTFLYDGLTGVWSTMQSGVQDGGRWNAQILTTFNFNTFAADYLSSNIYFVDPHSNIDESNPSDSGAIKRQVVSRHIYEQGNVFGIDEVMLDMETGTAQQNSEPHISMFVSKDQGHTYGIERVHSLGRVGKNKRRVVFRRLGSSRDFVLKFVTTDNIPFIASSASAVVRGGVEESQ